MIIVRDKNAPTTIQVTRRLMDGIQLVGGKKQMPQLEIPDDLKLGNSTFNTLPSYFSNIMPSKLNYLFADCPNLTELPILDFRKVSTHSNWLSNSPVKRVEGVINASNNLRALFSGCTSLVSVGKIDTRYVYDFAYMFDGCTSFKRIDDLNTSNATHMNYMFNGCTLLNHPLKNIEYCGNCDAIYQYSGIMGYNGDLDWPKATSLSRAFFDCNLETVGDCDFRSCTTASETFSLNGDLTRVGNIDFRSLNGANSNWFRSCDNLETIGDIRLDSFNASNVTVNNSSSSSLKNIGGFTNLGKGRVGNLELRLNYQKQLTEESVINIGNTIYPNDTEYTRRIRLYSQVRDTLDDTTIALFTNKGWTIQ